MKLSLIVNNGQNTAEKRQSQIESGQENPPLIKGDLIFSPFERGGVGGILKLKAFHIKITILYATYVTSQ